MSEILSQNQIDALLNELLGNAPERVLTKEDNKIKTYNFKTPKKLSRDQQKVLTGIYEVFARHMAAYLAGLTRSYCEITVVSVEEHPYFEYNNALPDILMTGIFDISLLKGAILLDMSDTLTFALIQRLFGGNINEIPTPRRDYTEIEMALMERIFKRAAMLLEEAWGHVPGVTVALRQMETNTRFIKSIAMDETVAVIVMNVRIGNVKGVMTCCVPCMGINEVMELFDKTERQDNMEAAEKEEMRKTILTQVNEADVEVCGILGTTTLTMREILSLQPGDVIKLDQHLDAPITVLINGKKWLTGRPGISRNQMAVKIGKPPKKEGHIL